MTQLAYRVGADRWDRLVAAPRRNYGLTAAGSRVVAYGPERGPNPPSAFLLTRNEKRWEELPEPPIRGRLVWSGHRLVLIGFDPAARDARNPPLARAATLRLGDAAWRRLPDSTRVLWGHGLWIRVGGRLISPELGTGNEDYDFGRPYGGILDPERGVWSELPNVPDPREDSRTEFGSGVFDPARLAGGSPANLVLNVAEERWIRVPRLWSDRNFTQGWTGVNAGRNLVIAAGARFTRRKPDGQLLNKAWIWAPP